MTNLEYILSNFTEKSFAEKLTKNLPLLLDYLKPFDKWAETTKNKGNSFSPKDSPENWPSVWKWEDWYNRDTGYWEKRGRKQELSLAVWLSLPYKKEDWE